MQNDIQTNYLPGIFLQKICSTTSTNVDLQAFPSHCELTPESVDAVIETEMKKAMSTYAAEEEKFVDRELIENPVVCERRTSNRSGSESSASNRDPLQQQRAESCRKSRINNKIKKAKSKIRHKFVTKKLAENAAGLESIRDLIAHAEDKLRSTGYSEAKVQQLRATMGLDRIKVGNLSEITKQLAQAPKN